MLILQIGLIPKCSHNFVNNMGKASLLTKTKISRLSLAKGLKNLKQYLNFKEMDLWKSIVSISNFEILYSDD